MTVFIRTVIFYVCVVTAMRIMGKRQLGELQPSEFVIALMISEIATIPIDKTDIPILHGIIPIFALVLLEFLCSILVIKSEKARRIITGSPVQIIKDGKLMMKRLTSLRICIDDVMEQLRLAGYSSISQIDSAIIETNGQLSVVPKEEERPLTCKDMNLSPPQTHVPHTIISDGVLRRNNLDGAGVTEKWLKKKLARYNITDYSQVDFLSVTDEKELVLQISEQ
ncbi:MAG: DUF421 domain-containing protein [Ruminococcaceae bacterium]|nr:DUF421 domain-containing protein [Oscillospiraceae bacterium]